MVEQCLPLVPIQFIPMLTTKESSNALADRFISPSLSLHQVLNVDMQISIS
jgi:hypothetical protein